MLIKSIVFERDDGFCCAHRISFRDAGLSLYHKKHHYRFLVEDILKSFNRELGLLAWFRIYLKLFHVKTLRAFN